MLIALTQGGVQNYGKYADIILERSLMVEIVASNIVASRLPEQWRLQHRRSCQLHNWNVLCRNWQKTQETRYSMDFERTSHKNFILS